MEEEGSVEDTVPEIRTHRQHIGSPLLHSLLYRLKREKLCIACYLACYQRKNGKFNI